MLLAMSVFKFVRGWWRLIAGLFFVCAAVERPINSGNTPGPRPTILYALCGSGLIFDGFRSFRNRSAPSPTEKYWLPPNPRPHAPPPLCQFPGTPSIVQEGGVFTFSVNENSGIHVVQLERVLRRFSYCVIVLLLAYPACSVDARKFYGIRIFGTLSVREDPVGKRFEVANYLVRNPSN